MHFGKVRTLRSDSEPLYNQIREDQFHIFLKAWCLALPSSLLSVQASALHGTKSSARYMGISGNKGL